MRNKSYLNLFGKPGERLAVLWFLAPRMAIVTVILMALAFVMEGMGLLAMLGVGFGALVSLRRIVFYGRLIKDMADKNSVKRAALYPAASLLMLFLALIVAMLADTGLFVGITAGMLILPFIICFNAFTELIGVTQNNWGWGKEGSLGACD